MRCVCSPTSFEGIDGLKGGSEQGLVMGATLPGIGGEFLTPSNVGDGAGALAILAENPAETDAI